MNDSNDPSRDQSEPGIPLADYRNEFDEDELQRAQPVLDLIQRVRQARQVSLQDTITPSVTIGDESVPTRLFVVDTEGNPQQVGSFRIIKRIGQGGFGSVFQAHDPRIDRDVAIKIPRPETLMDGNARERFLREARAAGALNHANIVTVFETGQEGPICFIAYAWCRGPSLHQWVLENHGPATPTDAIPALIALADAVQHAHARNITHRDIKPQNILLDRGHSDPPDSSKNESLASQLRITDFGLAHILNDEHSLTASGAMIGTPAYSAPEQLGRTDQQADHRVDIYGLGATLYFLLCGVPPFQGSSLLDTIRNVQEKSPLPLRKLRPDIPRDLESICLKCLEKKPEHRYQSASELQSDLIRCRDGLPILARRPSTLDRLILWSRRHPAVAGLSAILLVVLAAGSIVLSMLLMRSNDLKKLAEENARVASTERDRARSALDAMTSGLATQFLSSQKELSPEQRIFLERTASWYRELTSTAAMAPARTDQLWLALAEHRLAQLLFRLGETEQSLEAIDRTVEVLEQLLNEDETLDVVDALADALHSKDGMLAALGRLPDALPVAESAVEWSRKVVDADPGNTAAQTRLADTLGNWGSRLKGSRQLDPSLTAQSESVALKQLLVADNPDVAELQRSLGISLMNLGNLLTQLNRMSDAETTLDQALAIRRELAEDDPESFVYRHDLALISANLAGFHFRIGKMAQAEDYARQAVALSRALVEDYPLDEPYRRELVNALNTLSTLLNQRHNVDENIDALNELLAVATAAREDFPDVPAYALYWANGQSSMAEALADQGRVEEALTHHDRAIEGLEELRADGLELNRATPLLENAFYLRASSLERLERFHDALADFDAAIELAAEGAPADVLRLAQASLLVKLDRAEEAQGAVADATAREDQLPADARNFRIYYNAACVTALLAADAEATDSESWAQATVGYLQQAMDAGFRSAEILQQDSAFEALRDRPDFRALLDEMRQ